MKESGNRLLRAGVAAAVVVLVLWVIYALVWMLPVQPAALGIVPRTVSGLKGILLAPLVHADPAHLAANSGPLLLLLALSLYAGAKRTIAAVLIIVLLGGAVVWIAGGSGSHLGASGVVYGLIGFLGLWGFYRRKLWDLVVSVLVLVFFSALMGSLFRRQPEVSWISHLAGLAAGMAAAWLLGRCCRKDDAEQDSAGPEDAA